MLQARDSPHWASVAGLVLTSQSPLGQFQTQESPHLLNSQSLVSPRPKVTSYMVPLNLTTPEHFREH